MASQNPSTFSHTPPAARKAPATSTSTKGFAASAPVTESATSAKSWTSTRSAPRVALIAVGALTQTEYGAALREHGAVRLFAGGVAGFTGKLGLPHQTGTVFISLALAAFLMTTLDTATRLARFTWQELFLPRESREGAAAPASRVYTASGLSAPRRRSTDRPGLQTERSMPGLNRLPWSPNQNQRDLSPM